MKFTLFGVPLQVGASRLGCEMGPSAFRCAGLLEALEELGHTGRDAGNLSIGHVTPKKHPNEMIHNLAEIAAWIDVLAEAADKEDTMPIFMGGDHALSAGTVAGRARRAAREGRPFFVLWLDAHTDFHTLQSTQSGNLHGTPAAYFTGQQDFEGYYPPLSHAVKPENLCMIGIRSVDKAEREFIRQAGVTVHDMRTIDEHGVGVLLQDFLKKVEAVNGALHVSLDVDFLEPAIAPAVGTTVMGGATFREAHLIMEMLHDSGLVTSLDLAELNPFLDKHGMTALLMTDLVSSLMGKSVLDRPT